MTARPDYSRDAGATALGARLRRLSERIDRDGTRVYSVLGVRFEQRWFGILNQIRRNGPMSVTDIGAALRITHVSVSQARRSLESAGFIAGLPDDRDARRRTIGLTPEGQLLVQRLAPLWLALDDAAEELNAEAGNLVALLDQLEDALDARSLFDRVFDRLGPSLDKGQP